MPQTRADFLERLGMDPQNPGNPPRTAPPAVPWQWQYAKPGPYVTQLNPQEEAQFQQWVQMNKIPFDPSPTADYDMRGFWKAGGRGPGGINPNDNRPHFTDKYKTPYHHSFSGESMYANLATNPPRWNNADQLVDSSGRVLYDEHMAAPKPWTSATANIPKVQARPVERIPVTTPGMQGMIPPTAQMRAETMRDDFRRWNERLGRVEAAALGMDYDQQQEMANRGLLQQIIAFHGSPYIFEEFDPAKIGTGEGAATFGHGLYFAEEPEVAKSYQEKLSRGMMPTAEDLQEFFKPGEIRPSYGGHDRIVAFDPENYRVTAQAVKQDAAGNWVIDPRSPRPRVHGTMPSSTEFERAMGRKPTSNIGNLYKVDIRDEHVANMLDWDKPVTEQPKRVQEFLRKTYPGPPGMPFAKSGQPIRTGADIYRVLVEEEAQRVQQSFGRMQKHIPASFIDQGVQDVASERLKAAGIPGIRYLDRGSRQAGEGTRNLVIFDPKASITSTVRNPR